MLVVFPLFVLNAILDHAPTKDLAILLSSDCEDIFLELVSLSCQSLPLVPPHSRHCVSNQILKKKKNTSEKSEHFKTVW